MRRRSGLRLAAIVMTVLAAACSGGGATGADVDIPAQDPDLVARGEQLYQVSCAVCHGTDLRGTDLGPSHLSIVYEPNHHPDIAFLLAVKNGARAHHWQYGDMPPVPGLDDDDIAAIVAYVREQQRLNGFEPYPP